VSKGAGDHDARDFSEVTFFAEELVEICVESCATALEEKGDRSEEECSAGDEERSSGAGTCEGGEVEKSSQERDRDRRGKGKGKRQGKGNEEDDTQRRRAHDAPFGGEMAGPPFLSVAEWGMCVELPGD
jgi:hypothetical protein